MNKLKATKAKPLNSNVVPRRGQVRTAVPPVVVNRHEEVAKKVGARMRDLRLEHKMSLAQMQQCGGLTPSQMSSIERGHVQMTMGTVFSVALALRMPAFMVLLLPDEDPLSAVIEEIRQAYGGDWRRAAFVIAGALGVDLTKIMRKR